MGKKGDPQYWFKYGHEYVEATRAPRAREQREAWKLVNAVRAKTSGVWVEAYWRFGTGTISQLKEFLQSQLNVASFVEIVVAKAMLHVYENIDLDNVAKLQELMCGKPPGFANEGENEESSLFHGVPLDLILGMLQELEKKAKERQCNSTPSPQPSSESQAQLSPPSSDLES